MNLGVKKGIVALVFGQIEIKQEEFVGDYVQPVIIPGSRSVCVKHESRAVDWCVFNQGAL